MHKYRLLGVALAALLLIFLGIAGWAVGERVGSVRAGGETLRFGSERLTMLREARHDHYELRCRLTPAAAGVVGPLGDELLLAFGVKGVDDGALLRWNQRGIFLSQRRRGRESMLVELPLAMPEALALSREELVLRVKRDEIEVLAGGRRVLRAFAPGLGRGQIASGRGRRQFGVADLSYQRQEPFYFADDFMRTDEEAKAWGLWRPIAGNWKIYSVMERIHDNPAANIRQGREPVADRSPNPFCLSGSAAAGSAAAGSAAAGSALIVTGETYWCDYRAAVSVKPFGGVFGLVFGYRDEGNYWLLRWSADSLGTAPAPMQLIVREEGRERLVGSVDLGSRAENWWRLGLRQQGERMDALLDGVVVLSCQDSAAVGGAVGLYKEGEQEAYFDDLVVESVHELGQERLLAGAGREWTGKWRVEQAAEDSDADQALIVTGAAGPTLAESAKYLFGWEHWGPQRFAATLQLPPAGSVAAGLIFAWRDERNYWQAGWSPAEGGRLVVNRIQDDRTEEILALPYEWPLAEPLTMAVDNRQDGVLELWGNGILLLRQRLAPAAAVAQGGACGLFGDEGVRFSQVRAFAEQQRDWEQPVDIAKFADDPFMQGWASSRYAWLREEPATAGGYPQRYRHTGDFYGALVLKAPLQGGFKVFWGQDELRPAEGYELRCELDAATGGGALRLFRAGEPLAAAPFSGKSRSMLPGKQIIDEKIGAQPRTPDTESWGRLELHRDGHAIWVVLDGEELFCVHERTPQTGRAFGVEIAAPMDFIHLDVRREHLRDYLFERAETDWSSVGRWEVTNRFACDPRWSHMNGESRGVAALWSKFALAGDFTIECFAGMRMRQGELQEGAQMSYPRVGDINVALNGDGRELFSGYNLVVAAWDERWTETWTQFWRQDAVVAQTDRELIPRGRHLSPDSRPVAQEWDPGGRPVHGAWYALKIRRTGSRYEVSFDNTPVFSYTDDAPLADGKLSLWTQHNSIVLARVKVSYRTLRLTAPLLAAVPGELQGRAGGAVGADTATAVTTTAAAAAQPTPLLGLDFEAGLDGVAPWHGDQSARLRRQAHVGRDGHFLQATNINSGGDFGLSLPWSGVALHRVRELRVSGKIPAGVMVNLYFTIKDDPLGRYFVTLSGPGHDEANLHGVGSMIGLQTGEWSRLSIALGEALRARFPERDQWVVDSAMIGMLHEGYLNAGLGGNHAGAEYALDDIVLTDCGPTPAVAAPRLEPGDGAAWGLNPIRVLLPSDKLFWPRFGGMVLNAGGQALALHDGNSALDVAAGVLLIQPLFTGKIMADADGMVAFSLVYRHSDQSADSEPQRLSWRYRLQPSDDRTPPGRPVLAGALSSLCGLRPWQEEGKMANAKSQVAIKRYVRSDGTPAARVSNRICGSDFGFSFGLPSFNLAQSPILMFDYKIPPESHIDLLVRVLGKMHTIGLTDVDKSRDLLLGAVPGVIADDSWRRAVLDLRDFASGLSVAYDGTDLATTDLALGNWHYSGEAVGNRYDVSQVMLAPLVSLATAPLKLSWQLADPGSITAYSYAWSADPDTAPDTVADGAGTSVEATGLADGMHYFHIRACDQAGNWGPPAHYPFMVDERQPQIVAVSPLDGTAAAPEQLSVTFDSDAGAWLDFSQAKLQINGDARNLNRSNLQWDQSTRRLTFDMLRDWGLLNKVVADGTAFTAELSGIRSFAGREIPAKRWQWRLDYALDKTAPQPPMVVGNDSVFQNTESFSGSHYWRGQAQTSLAVVRDDAIASQCLEIRYRAKDGGRFQANAWMRRDLLKDCPALRFRYQIMPGTRVNLMLMIEREWYTVRMTGSDEAPVIGDIADARDDGQWRWAMVDLPALVAKAVPNKADARLMQVAFGERGAAADENVLRIDDFSAVGVFGPLPLITLQRTDASGIAAYEAKLSMDPDDEPRLTMDAQGSRRPALQAADQAGLWFVHARCRDGAGNSSEVIHIPFWCREPASLQAAGDGWEAGEDGSWRLRGVQRSQTPNAALWTVRAGEANRLLGVQFYGGRSQPMELYRAMPEAGTEEWKNGLSVDLFLQGEGDVDVQAAVYLADQSRPVLSKPVSIKGGDGWRRSLRLSFAEIDTAVKGAPSHVALRLKRNDRSLGMLLLDSCHWQKPDRAN